MSSKEVHLELSALSPLSRSLAHQRQQLPSHEQPPTATSTLTGPAAQLHYVQSQPSVVSGRGGPRFAAARLPSAPSPQLPTPPRGYIPPAQQYPAAQHLDMHLQPPVPGCLYSSGQPTGSTAAAMLPALSAPPDLPMEPNPQLPHAQYTTAVRDPYSFYASPAPPAAAPNQDLGVVPVPGPMQLVQGREQPRRPTPTATPPPPITAAEAPEAASPPVPPTHTPLTSVDALRSNSPSSSHIPLQPTADEALLHVVSPPSPAGRGALTMPPVVPSTRTLSAPPPPPSYPTPSFSQPQQPYRVAYPAEGFQQQHQPQCATKCAPTALEQMQPPPPASHAPLPPPARVPYAGVPYAGVPLSGGALTPATWPGCLPPFQPPHNLVGCTGMPQHGHSLPPPPPGQPQPQQPALRGFAPGGSQLPLSVRQPTAGYRFTASRQPPSMATGTSPGSHHQMPLSQSDLSAGNPYAVGGALLPNGGVCQWGPPPGGDAPYGPATVPAPFYPAGPAAGASAFAPVAVGIPVPSSSLAPHDARNSSGSSSSSSSKPGGEAPLSLIAAKSLGGVAVVALQRSAQAMGKLAGKLDKGVARLKDKEAEWERKREQKRRFRMGECAEAGGSDGLEDKEQR